MASASSNSEEAIVLYMTPMLDIFSILITFLLMSFSTDPVNHEVSQNIELPQSRTLIALDEVPTVIVTRSEIFVNDKKIVSILNGDVPEQDRSQGAVVALYTELQKLSDTAKKFRRPGLSDSKLNTLTMEMDQGHRFKLMKRIMLSAQQADFITFKLMTEREAG